ncbi:Hypothetical protein PHPALM_15715 [Phytophthora palmivora]|uniref:Uncharacterized protein n=1 Tax=Phytophthora palmivora TaxID=4796 RepID=A0A2P4XRG3_9STRA|nr:Hypothetical protein PHPALM_15715 [Phytophthora palmivora]
MTTAALDTNGWHEVEQTLTALELPPVPPTSDPQRLLGYVLHILPRYTEMEVMSTHLRLYSSTLEQDMEQIKSHVRLLTREAASEREKKQFLERYAAQVVKERNDLLHSRGSSKKKASAGASHFVWHNCCKKNTRHALDLAPSILAFRGEKLQEATKQIESLQEEVRSQEQLRKELDFLLKKTQREHDSKVAAERKHIQQLEKQILQRSTLYSSLERKLYEVESMLARHDKTKDEELNVVSNRIEEAQTRIAGLEKENASLHEQVSGLSSDRDRLMELLEETTESKDMFAERIDELMGKCESLESEVEALRSEIDMLQTNDINDIRTQYAARIELLQKDNAANEQKLRQEVDRMKQELKKRDDVQAQTFSAHQWSDGIFDDDRQLESDGVGSSLSRSQLSESHQSFGLSSVSQRDVILSKEIGAANNSFSTMSHKEDISRQSYAMSSKQGYSRELDAVSRDLSVSSKQIDTGSHENTSAANEPFDWEAFIDNASEISTVQHERARHTHLAIPRSLNLSTSTIHHVDSTARVSESSKVRVDSFDGEQLDGEVSFLSSTDEGVSFSKSRSFTEVNLGNDEEEKEADKDVDNEEHCDDLSSVDDTACSVEQEQSDDSRDTTVEVEHAKNDLARDLFQMLNGLEQKRKEEEQKASKAEQALLEFEQLQHGMEALQLSPNS